jgi:hypothetical protein
MRPSIETLATVFRRAIEESDVSSDIGFKKFPRGACGDASLLLSEFLRRHGFQDIDYVSGWARKDSLPQGAHAWLELDGMIVDITADQFPARPAPPVLVTTDRGWHTHFLDRDHDRHPARIDDYDPATGARLLALFAEVLQHVPESLRRGAG